MIEWSQTETSRCLHLRAENLTTAALVAIAACARANGIRITFTGLENRSLSELVKIAAAGGRWEGRTDRARAEAPQANQAA